MSASKPRLQRSDVQLAAALKLRRPHVPAYCGDEWTILDSIHSQILEYQEGGQRVWANETWMSDKVFYRQLESLSLPSES